MDYIVFSWNLSVEVIIINMIIFGDMTIKELIKIK